MNLYACADTKPGNIDDVFGLEAHTRPMFGRTLFTITQRRRRRREGGGRWRLEHNTQETGGLMTALAKMDQRLAEKRNGEHKKCQKLLLPVWREIEV